MKKINVTLGIGFIVSILSYSSYAAEEKKGTVIVGGVEKSAASGFSPNIFIKSNYVFRGKTLSDNKPSIAAGVDYFASNGFYGGVWVITVDIAPDKDVQTHLFAGYNGSFSNNVSYDIHTTNLQYPGTDSGAGKYFNLIDGSLSYKAVTLAYSHVVNSDIDAVEGSSAIDLKLKHKVKKVTYGAKVGLSNTKVPGANDHNYYQLSASPTLPPKWGNLVFDIDKADDEDMHVSMTWSKFFKM